MLRFLAGRRFNYFDTVSQSIAMLLFASAMPLYAVLALISGAVISVTAEGWASSHG